MMKLGIFTCVLLVVCGFAASAYAITIDLYPKLDKFKFNLSGDTFDPMMGDEFKFEAFNDPALEGTKWKIEIKDDKENYKIENKDIKFKTEDAFDSYALTALGGDGYHFHGVFFDDLLSDQLDFEGDNVRWHVNVYFLAADNGTWQGGTVSSGDLTGPTPTPEPATILLVGIGLLGLGSAGRKMTRK